MPPSEEMDCRIALNPILVSISFLPIHQVFPQKWFLHLPIQAAGRKMNNRGEPCSCQGLLLQLALQLLLACRLLYGGCASESHLPNLKQQPPQNLRSEEHTSELQS